MTDLTFTRLLTDGGLRHWDLRGPAGLLRFEIAGIRHPAVYLHATTAPGGADLEPCDVCGRCWYDAMTPDAAQALYEDWKTAAYHDAVIRTQLERWYTENLARWTEDDHQTCAKCGDQVYTLSSRNWCDGCEEEAARRQPASTADQVVPAKDLAMLLAQHAPDLPYIDLGRLAAALSDAGYQVVCKTTDEAGASC